MARETSAPRIVARETSAPRIEAWETSAPSIEAWGYAMLRLFGHLIKATASINVSVTLANGATCEGGRQVVVKDPVTGAEWCEHYGIRPDAPFKVDGLDAKILGAIKAGQGTLDMSTWHGEDAVDATNWCGTTHCRAGYAICMAGPAGFDLERKFGSERAGRMIYAVSRPDKPLPDFYASDDEAMEDMEAAARDRSA